MFASVILFYRCHSVFLEAIVFCICHSVSLAVILFLHVILFHRCDSMLVVLVLLQVIFCFKVLFWFTSVIQFYMYHYVSEVSFCGSCVMLF